MQAESTKTLNFSSEHLPLAAQGLKHFLRDLEYGYLSIHFDHSPSLHLRGHHDGPHAHWHLHQPARLLAPIDHAEAARYALHAPDPRALPAAVAFSTSFI